MKESRKWRTCWKLTDANHVTHGGCRWGEDVTNPVGKRSGDGPLCSDSWYHAYDSPYTAILMNPIHANIKTPVLWQAEWRGGFLDDRGLKFGATELRTVRIVDAPAVTLNQQVAVAILCAAQVYDKSEPWLEWAAKWLAGEDRSAAAAHDAADAAYAAANAAAADAAYAAAYAAYAAYAAANAANAAAANAAANAAYAAAYAAAAAAYRVEDAIAWALALEET